MSTTALHGDVVGYSRLIADNEIETHNTVQAFRSIIEAVVEDHDGELAQFVGDEFLAVLPSERAGSLAAIEIQRRLAEENLSLPEGRKMRFRLGLNSGEIHHGDSGWYGDTINIAARLQAIADPGGVTVSAAVFDQSDELDVRHSSIGAQRLKNIPEPVHAYRLVDDGLPTETDKPWRRRIPTTSTPSLAVSPFVNLGAPEDEHFAAGLFMSLIVSLMRIPGLDVKSENSSLAYRDQAYSAQQVGHELGARYVLEAGVHRAGDRVRVMTQLIDVEEKKTTWADRFETSIGDLFAAQDDLVAQIVVALDIQVMGGGSRLYREYLDSTSVELVYQGWTELIRGTKEATRKARDHFEAVTETAPESPVGYSTAAWGYVWEVLQGWASDPGANIDRAEELASKAIELDDPSGFSYAVMAYVRLVRQDWDGAYESAMRATSERPSCDVSW
jgi:adenylate cyclase